ncbi:MAG TPA: bifunctional serine/threonine-protein kinase/formylglycine-generating enzyme family protein [Chloroflexota bacterium]|nr:bifunctional serine/threonine-protein kinase/formylglycine-generating enzyme family protein [Chloroflexota bacterium]
MPLLPGELLHKRYRIINLLAEGPYGAVYRAWDVADGLDTAVKEYLDPSVEIQKRFRQQARQLSRLEHPQLPRLLDHFALEGVGQYLVWTYVDGVDLRALGQQYGRLPSDLIITWLQAACQPLIYLHEQGQLHLNIKPANIRLTPTGQIFLVDSGLPDLGIRPHTDGYGAPEQQAQLEVTAASDIYSLGATLYTLLTGKIPPGALKRESGLADLTPAREINPDVEPYLSIVAGRAMSIGPEARFGSAAEFAAALARPYGRTEPDPMPLRRTAVTDRFGPPTQPRLTPQLRRQIEMRTIYGLIGLLLFLLLAGYALARSNINQSTVTSVEATATIETAVVAAMTALAPTPSPLPVPTDPPTPTPEPLITETGARMIYMPGGIFSMGSEEGERDERPIHLVNMSPFYIDETEVTNGQYQLCVEAGGCAVPSRANPTTHPAYYGDPAFADYPVVFVNWYMARSFCEWRGARLPTEAEWEMAAAFDPVQQIKLRYPWGDAFDGTKLNYCDQNCPSANRDTAFNDGHRDTAPVGSYPDGRSPSGVYDMAGNVMEWVADWYDFRYYTGSTDTNPMGPTDGEFKSLRGGSWLSPRDEVRAAARGSFDPRVIQANLGFRCALTGGAE